MASLFVTDQEFHGDVKLFKVDREEYADICVFISDKKEYSRHKECCWYLEENEFSTKKIIFFCSKEEEADLKVFFVKNEWEAKWRRENHKLKGWFTD